LEPFRASEQTDDAFKEATGFNGKSFELLLMHIANPLTLLDFAILAKVHLSAVSSKNPEKTEKTEKVINSTQH
jgi:hypothetical protein